ncbi:MAG: GNAT family N-acetyltransferase [Spirosomataceae bacterium]
MSSNFVITTPRIGLRPWKDSDQAPFIQMNADPRVMEFFPSCLSADETLAMIERIQQFIKTNGFGFWAAELLQTQQFIGFIGLSMPRFEASFTPCVEIGWRLMPEFWGQGLATEGAAACLTYAFEQLNLNEVVSFTTVTNLRSMRVMQKIGMKHILNFMHPSLPINHPLSEHVLYQIQNPLHERA